LIRRKVSGGETNQIGFGMAGTITLGHDRILGLQANDVVIIHEDRPKGMIAMLAGLCREGDG
jgi:hypothetical protein